MFQRPSTLAATVDRLRAGEAWALAVPEFLDTFYMALRGGNSVDPEWCLVAVPAALDDPLQNAMIGGIGEHLARRWCFAVPNWTQCKTRYLPQPVYDTGAPSARLRAETPAAFWPRNIYTEAEPLRRARFPQAQHRPRDQARGFVWTPNAVRGVFGLEGNAQIQTMNSQAIDPIAPLGHPL
jgi:hypothetical protein